MQAVVQVREQVDQSGYGGVGNELVCGSLVVTRGETSLTAPAPVAPVPTVPEPAPKTPEVDPDESVPLPTFTPDVNPDTSPFPNLPLLEPDEDPNRFGTCRAE